MTAAVYDNDIDKFIQDQKSKLANERQRLNDDGENKRRTWDRTGHNDYKLAEQTQRRPVSGGRTGLPIGGDDADLKKRQMQAERNREYNEMIQKKPRPQQRIPVTPFTPMTRQHARESDTEAPAPAPVREHAPPRQAEHQEPPPQRVKASQLEVLEDIGRREEQLRRKLDEETIREADQEKTLQEEVWRRHQGNPPELKEVRPRRRYVKTEAQHEASTRRTPEPGHPFPHYNELRREYIPLKEKPTAHNRRLWREPSEELGLPIGEYENKKKQLADQRRRDMQANLSKQQQQQQPSSRRQWQDSDQSGLKFATQDQAATFNAEKRQEYNEAISKKPRQNREWREPSANGGVLFVGEMEKKHLAQQKLAEEKRQAYLKKLGPKDPRSDLPPKPATPGGFLNRLGRDEGRRQQLSEERRQEYNRLMSEKQQRGGGRRPDGDYGATIPGLRGADSAKLEKVKRRNEEYNQFLREKEGQKRPRGQVRTQGQEGPPGAPRKGWATPTYEEMLDKKRQEEARYRRYDDPEYSRPGMKSYGSEGALNGIDGERRGKGLDTDLDKRLRISNGHRSILDDPLWLSPRRGDNYDREAPRYQETAPPRDQGPPPRNTEPGYYATLPVGSHERMSAQQRKKEQYRKELQQQIMEASEAKRREKQDGMKVSATGANDPEKRQDRLRGLGASSVPPPPPPQQAPIVIAPPVYKIADPVPVLSASLADYDKVSPRSELVLGRKSLFKGDHQWEQIQQLDRINFDLDRKRYTAPASNNSTGILDRGFDSLLEPPRVSSIKAPPGLEYQPSTFVTGGGGGSFSSLDETYHYLATKNPLDPEVAGAAHPGVAAVAIPQAGAATGGSTARVRFDDGRRQAPGGGATFAVEVDDSKATARAKAQMYQLELAKQIEEDKMKKAKQRAQQEWYDMKLEEEAKSYNPYGKGGGGAPMKDDRGNIIADLRSLRRPGGPPTTAGVYAGTSPRPPSPRDDLIRTPPLQTTAAGEPSHARGGHGIFGQPKTDAEKHQTDVYKDDLRRQIEAKKAAAALEREKERYEEEKEQRRIDAERKRMQEEYEEERKKIKLKEDEARRKNEELMRQAEERKREADQRRNDAEDERRRQQEEADRERLEREAAERGKSPPLPAVGRKQATEHTPEPADKALTYRASSPPVPAARTSLAAENRPHSVARQQDEEAEPRYVPSALSNRIDGPLLDRGRSPVDRAPSSSRAPSADILNALARMKHQLASERDRVETMLDKSENEPEVFDPRLAQRPPPVPRVQRDIDVFEMARNRNTVPVRRAPTADNNPHPEHLREFHDLKQADTDSRQEFKRQYPYDPMSNDHLEQQQAALIRQQEQNLRELRGKSKFEKALPNMEPKDLGLNRHRTISPQPMLQSNSAFIDMNGLGPVFPDDLDDLPRRNESARQRRREGLFPSPRPGSVTSLDVDQIARKNEQRLKKLRDIQGDDLSLNDPDDVLDRFMSKQAHNRPPTSQTMQDDSWLQPGSKLSRY